MNILEIVDKIDRDKMGTPFKRGDKIITLYGRVGEIASVCGDETCLIEVKFDGVITPGFFTQCGKRFVEDELQYIYHFKKTRECELKELKDILVEKNFVYDIENCYLYWDSDDELVGYNSFYGREIFGIKFYDKNSIEEFVRKSNESNVTKEELFKMLG